MFDSTHASRLIRDESRSVGCVVSLFGAAGRRVDFLFSALVVCQADLKKAQAVAPEDKGEESAAAVAHIHTVDYFNISCIFIFIFVRTRHTDRCLLFLLTGI